MKNITAWVIDQARIVPYPTTTRPNRPFLLPQTAVNNAKPISPAQTSVHSPSFALQISAPTPTDRKKISRNPSENTVKK
jgi:hypothetical protein